MKPVAAITTILIFIGTNLFGQDELRPYSRGQLKTNIGYRLGGTDLRQGFITDPLIKSDLEREYWQLISFSYFFFPHWGAEITIEPLTSNNSSVSDIQGELEEIYGSKYFVEYYPSSYNSGSPLMYLGLTYRFQNNKLQGQVKVLYSYMDISLSEARADLKEKGSNHTLNLTYDHEMDRNISLGPSITLAYRIYKIFMVNLNLTYLYTSLVFNYREAIADPYTEISATKKINYDASLNTFSAGLGICIEFGSFGHKR